MPNKTQLQQGCWDVAGRFSTLISAKLKFFTVHKVRATYFCGSPLLKITWKLKEIWNMKVENKFHKESEKNSS